MTKREKLTRLTMAADGIHSVCQGDMQFCDGKLFKAYSLVTESIRELQKEIIDDDDN